MLMNILVGNKAKGWISKRVFNKTKHAKFSEKLTFTPWYTHIEMFFFLENFWNTCFEIRPFALLPTFCLTLYTLTCVRGCLYESWDKIIKGIRGQLPCMNNYLIVFMSFLESISPSQV